MLSSVEEFCGVVVEFCNSSSASVMLILLELVESVAAGVGETAVPGNSGCLVLVENVVVTTVRSSDVSFCLFSWSARFLSSSVNIAMEPDAFPLLFSLIGSIVVATELSFSAPLSVYAVS